MKTLKLVLLALIASFGMQAQELVAGQATLTKIKNGIYEIEKEDGTLKTIDIRPDAENYTRGTLAVLFKECEVSRQAVFNLIEITESNLVQAVKDYNNCDYTPFEPTSKEIKRASDFQGDQYKFFAGLGASVNRIDFFNQDDYESLTQGELSFGIAATPGFTRSLQGNLYFTLELNAAFSGDKDFSKSPFDTNLKKNSYQASFGAEYHFNKNGSIQPLIGVGVGLAHSEFRGSYNDYEIKENQGNGFWMPKIGVLFSLDEKKSLGLIVSYIPKYGNDLSFINSEEEIIPFTFETHHLNAGLYLYF